MKALAELEAAAARALPHDEANLFAQSLPLFGFDGRAFLESKAFADAAMALHRSLMPNNGYQLGATCSGRGIASSWRRGDAHTLPFEAATPGLALLRATAHAAARAQEAETRMRCGLCRGRGWIITRDGGKRVCAHTSL